jgi:putative transposase
MTVIDVKAGAQVAESDEPAVRPGGVNPELVGRLVAQAREQGMGLTGEGGLLAELTRRVLESALEGELTDHLGYDKHDAAGDGSGNSRNGKRSRKVITDVSLCQAQSA